MRKTISRRTLEAQPQELYKIKIGGRGKVRRTAGGGESYIPEKYDHFVITRTDRGRDSKGNFSLATEIHAEVGPEPTELDIRLTGETVEDNFRSELCQYSGQTKVLVCDGETARDLKTGVERPCQNARNGGCKCKPYARFACMLEASPTMGGAAVFRTTGWKSTNNLQTTLEFFESTFGTLLGLPLRLVLYPSTDTYMDGGKAKTSTSHKVGLVLRAGLKEVLEAASENLTMLAEHRQKVRLLHAGNLEAIEHQEVLDAEEIQQEYFPDPDHVASIRTQEKVEGMKEELGIGAEPADEIEDDDLDFAQREMVETVRGLMDETGLDAEGATAVENAIAAGKWDTVERAITKLEAAKKEGEGAQERLEF